MLSSMVRPLEPSSVPSHSPLLLPQNLSFSPSWEQLWPTHTKSIFMGVIGMILRRLPGFYTLPLCIHPHIPQDCELDEFYSHDQVSHDTIDFKKKRLSGWAWPNHMSPWKAESVLWLVADGAARETGSSWPGRKQISTVRIASWQLAGK